MSFGLKTLLTATTLGAALLAAPAFADPLDPAHIPADSKWVVHVDMDAIRKSETWKSVYDRLQRNDNFQDKVQEIETIFNARFPDDLHDVTLTGAVFGDKAGVVLVHATVDRKQVETLLAQNPGYASEARGNHSLLTWTDKGVTNYGGFFDNGQFLIGQDKDRVSAMIDTLDGKTAPMKPEAGLLKGVQKDAMVYIAGDELGKLKQAQAAQSPLLTQMNSAYIVLSEGKDDVTLKVNVIAADAVTADKMRQTAEGMKAMLSLAGGEPDAKPNIKMLVDLTSAAVITSKDNTVSAELHVAQKKVPDLLDQAMSGDKAEKAVKPEPAKK